METEFAILDTATSTARGERQTELQKRLSISYQDCQDSEQSFGSDEETPSEIAEQQAEIAEEQARLHGALNKLCARMRTRRDWERMSECFAAHGGKHGAVNQVAMLDALCSYAGLVLLPGQRTGLEQLTRGEARAATAEFFPAGQTSETFEGFRETVRRRRRQLAVRKLKQQRRGAAASRRRMLDASARMVHEHEALAATQMVMPKRAGGARTKLSEMHHPFYLQETQARQRGRSSSPTTVLMATGCLPPSTASAPQFAEGGGSSEDSEHGGAPMLLLGAGGGSGGGSGGGGDDDDDIGHQTAGERRLAASRRPPSPLFQRYMATSPTRPQHRRKIWVQNAVRAFHGTLGNGSSSSSSSIGGGGGGGGGGDANPELFHEGRAALFDLFVERKVGAIPGVPLAHRPRRLCRLDLLEGKKIDQDLAGTSARPKSPSQRECSLFSEVATGAADAAVQPMFRTVVTEARPFGVGGLYIPQIG